MFIVRHNRVEPSRRMVASAHTQRESEFQHVRPNNECSLGFVGRLASPKLSYPTIYGTTLSQSFADGTEPTL